MEETSRDEIIKIAIEEFSRLQQFMSLSEENSQAYDEMMVRYIELKVFLTSAGINLTQLDRINK